MSGQAPSQSRRATMLRKLATPRLGRVFDRHRLFGLLDDLADSPAIWVSAPPGAGKTALVATWLRHCGGCHFWFQLDAADADPATFVQSLDTLLTSKLTSPVNLPAFRSDDLSDLSGWLRRRVGHLLPLIVPRWTLVLDNHHELPPDSPIHAALANVLTALPAGVQWVFISREAPSAAYSIALANQQITLVDAEQLEMDATETRQMTKLHGRTEETVALLAPARGWAAGMTLMLLGSPPGGAATAIDARERLFDYFAGEVLSRMHAHEQRALSALAWLPSATAEVAVAMTGYPAAAALLERLCAASLFTYRREGSPPAYSFHDLFGEFLRKRFARNATPEEVQALQLRAGRLLAGGGDIDAALGCFVDAKAWDAAVSLIDRSASRYVGEGRTLALLQHIEALPPQSRAPLLYWQGFCRLDVDPAAALADLMRAHDTAVARADVEGQLAAAAGAATALLALGQIAALDRWIDVLDANRAEVLADRDEESESRVIPGMLAMLVHRAPWHPLSGPLADRAERTLYRESSGGQQLLVGTLAYHLLWRGQVDRLERLLVRIDALCAQQLAAPVTVMRWWGVGILVKSLLGHHASAKADADAAVAATESEPSLGARRANARLLATIVALAMGDKSAARTHVGRAAQALHPGNVVDLTMYEHQQGMLALLDDDGPSALRLMRACVRSASGSGFPMREHIALIAQALAAAHCDEHDEAERVLGQVMSHAFFSIGGWHNWIAGLVAAYAALRRGAHEDVERWLRLALRVAGECGFRHGPMLFCCPGMMPRLMAFALTRRIEPAVARDVIARNQLRAPLEADASWPWAVRVWVLGPLEVEVDGKPLVSSRKESRRLLELLAILAAAGSGPVALDTVADELWPESDGDAARNALDNALHRLRKALGGDDRILLRHGALSLNQQRCWTDVGSLEANLEHLASAPTSVIAEVVRALERLGTNVESAGAGSFVAARRRSLQKQTYRALRAAEGRLREAGVASALIESWKRDESLPNR